MTNDLILSRRKEDKLYVDDVFQSWLRTGTGADVTVNTGIDMTEGYMLWSKSRSGATDHAVYDSGRGVTKDLVTNSAASETTQATGLKDVSTTGHTIGSLAKMNTSGQTYVDWVFRRAPKFFDIVTYTGDGVAGRQILHELGVAPGMIVVKRLTTSNWFVQHRYDYTKRLRLNGTGAEESDDGVVFGTPTEEYFTIGLGAANINLSGTQYVAYLWAHDPAEDGIVQCGSFTTDASGNATVNLGWEPQYLMVKRSDNLGSWYLVDQMRKWIANPGAGLNTARGLYVNVANPESNDVVGSPNAVGFSHKADSSAQFIYLAIRRPNKPPTSGTEVYNSIARAGSSTATTITGVGFTPDVALIKNRLGLNDNNDWSYNFFDRIRGNGYRLSSRFTNAEDTFISFLTLYMDGVVLPSTGYTATNESGYNYINHFFRRSPGFHDQICYTGTGVNKTEAHNLGKQPELWLAKRRNVAGAWAWGSTLLNANEKIAMPSVNGRVTDATAWNSTYPTDTNISLGTLADVNASGGTYTLYMWATMAGISKVGTYTGNGSSQTIDCGFTTGARFVMIIRMTASTAQDIYLWDSARGIVAGNDPRLSLNTTAAEVTTLDTVDVAATGFIVNQDASNVNVNGAEYIFLAIA